MVLKPWQNEKSQTFVGMLVFWIFFCRRQLFQIQNKDPKQQASQQTVGSYCFYRALVTPSIMSYLSVMCLNFDDDTTKALEITRLDISHYIQPSNLSSALDTTYIKHLVSDYL